MEISDPVLYGIFAAIVTVLLAIDLFVVQRDTHAVSIREAAIWSAIWIGVSILFGVFLTQFHEGPPGENSTVSYFTGYVIEKSLSVDNVFLFVLIFGALSVPREYQHRVLFYGVAGAIVMRTVLIFTGAALIERFSWVLWVFGLFLIYTAIQTWRQRNEHPDVAESALLRRIRRFLPTTEDYVGDRFLVRRDGHLLATPMLVVLVLVEFTDLIFAVDSIPAIFAVTQDPFVVLTSNIFAILGLRSLYFLLAGVADQLRYLKAGLAIILGYVGVKLILEQTPYEFLHVPPLVSLGIILGILAVTVVASLRAGPSEDPDEVPAGIGNVFHSDNESDASRRSPVAPAPPGGDAAGVDTVDQDLRAVEPVVAAPAGRLVVSTDLREALRYAGWVFLGVRVGLGLLALLGLSLVPANGELLDRFEQVQEPGWGMLLGAWERWDAQYYLRIIDAGYPIGDARAAFFPLYPMLAWVVRPLVGGSSLAAALVVSNLALFAALVVLYRLTAR